MFKNPSFLFDIICTVVWVILMVRYARKGFLASMVGLVGNLLRLRKETVKESRYLKELF